MKAQFIVTIEGNWREGDKRVTKAMMLRDLRKGVREQFEFLAKKTAVSALPSKSAAPIAQRGEESHE